MADALIVRNPPLWWGDTNETLLDLRGPEIGLALGYLLEKPGERAYITEVLNALIDKDLILFEAACLAWRHQWELFWVGVAIPQWDGWSSDFEQWPTLDDYNLVMSIISDSPFATGSQHRAARRALNPNAGYVYVLGGGEPPYYKIGMTLRNPTNRVSEFAPKLPFETEIVCFFEAQDRRAVEGALHERFADKRTNGEWFLLEPPDLEYLTGLAANEPVSYEMIE